MVLVVWSVFLLLLCTIGYFVVKKLKVDRLYGHIPCIPGYPLGIYWRFLRSKDLHEVLRESVSIGPLVRLTMLPWVPPFLLVNDPAIAKEIMWKDEETYGKTPTDPQDEREVTALGLARVCGGVWKRQRRLIDPLFTDRSCLELSPRMKEALETLLQKWRKATEATGSAVVDVKEDLSMYTMEGVCKALFGVDFDVQRQNETKMVSLVTYFILDSATRSFQPDWVTYLRKMDNDYRLKNIRALKQVTKLIIKSYASSPGITESNLLVKLLNALDENGNSLSPEEIESQVMTFFLSGHESVSTTLCWAVLMLVQNPHKLKSLHEEIDEISRNGKPSAQDIQTKTPYLEKIIWETLRMYGPTYMLFRILKAEDVEVLNHKIPAGSCMMISPFAIHHDPKYYENPNEFIPERWTPEFYHDASKNGYYFPFGAGKRICVGRKFAMLETKIGIYEIFSQFNLKLVSGQTITPSATILLRPADSVNVTITKK